MPTDPYFASCLKNTHTHIVCSVSTFTSPTGNGRQFNVYCTLVQRSNVIEMTEKQPRFNQWAVTFSQIAKLILLCRPLVALTLTVTVFFLPLYFMGWIYYLIRLMECFPFLDANWYSSIGQHEHVPAKCRLAKGKCIAYLYWLFRFCKVENLTKKQQMTPLFCIIYPLYLFSLIQ